MSGKLILRTNPSQFTSRQDEQRSARPLGTIPFPLLQADADIESIEFMLVFVPHHFCIQHLSILQLFTVLYL